MRVGRIFYDLAKAFDFMNHEILLGKLRLYGIRGESEGWLKFYLTSRRQKFEVISPTSTQFFFSDWITLKQECYYIWLLYIVRIWFSIFYRNNYTRIFTHNANM